MQRKLLKRMSERSPQRYWKYFRDGEAYLPSIRAQRAKKRDPTILQQHTEYLEQLYINDPTTTLGQAQALLQTCFDVSITQSGLQKHLVKHCGLTMKKIEPVSEARNSPETIKKRMNWAMDVTNRGLKYEECIFIDEAGFNMYIQRCFGRSKKGQPAKALVPKSRGATITILGAICVEGVLNLSLRKPQLISGTKKRKLAGDKPEKIKVGTRAEHFLEFIKTVMRVVLENGLKQRIIVLDNAAIHHTKEVEAALAGDFEFLFLPPYSPVANPIELFWSKLKSGVRRNTLTSADTLTPRIINSAYLVTSQDCKGWIKHAAGYIPRFIMEE